MEYDINDLCVGRVYLEELEDDLENDDSEDDVFGEPDFYEPPPPPPMPKIGRNEPCWCGSGKKYKKCHLASDEADPAARSKEAAGPEDEKQLASRLAQGILAGSPRWHTQSDLKRATSEYFERDPATLDPGEENGYLQWYTHDFRDSRTNKSLVEHLWDNRDILTPRTQEILEAWRNSYPGVFEVTRVEKGLGLELRNVATDEIRFVRDVLGSKDARVGEWLLQRLEFLDGRWQLVSDGFRVQAGLESQLLKHIQTEAEAADETPDEFVRRNGNRLYRVLRRMGLGPVQ